MRVLLYIAVVALPSPALAGDVCPILVSMLGQSQKRSVEAAEQASACLADVRPSTNIGRDLDRCRSVADYAVSSARAAQDRYEKVAFGCETRRQVAPK